MPVVDVVNLDGKKSRSGGAGGRDFWRQGQPALAARSLALVSARAGVRATHKTKDKSEVSGAGRKLWKQKGTGPRGASVRSVRLSGAMAARFHGPKPRDYSYALPKKMLLGALRLGALGEARGAEADGCGCVDTRDTQDQSRCSRCWTN